MKKIKPIHILLGILFLIITLFVTTYAYVANIDWNKHKDRLVDQVMATTGKKIVFDGDVNFSLLPAPYLEAKDVKLYDNDGEILLADIQSLIVELQLFPLLKGSLQVVSMELRDAQLNVKLSEKGKSNWATVEKIDDYSRPSIEKLDMDLIELKNSEILFEDEINDIKLDIKGITAKIKSEALEGPYQIEGNFLYNKETLGFLISVGAREEENPLNVAIIHAPTESYIRFDGNFVPEESVLTGSILTESKDPAVIAKIFNENFEDFPEEKETLTISTEIKTNKNKIDLSNFVIRYGNNVGAGNIVIPTLRSLGAVRNRRLKIDSVFEMTDLNLDLFEKVLKNKVLEIWNSKKAYSPSFKYDLVFDLRSVRTIYKGQELQKFNLGLEIINNIFVVKNLSANVPGNTNVATRGRIFPEGEKLTYNLDVAFITEDFQKAANWLGYAPKIVAPATYKNAQAAMNVSGTPDNLKIQPMKIMFDKMNFEAEVSYISGEDKTLSIIAQSSNIINFDNYLAPLPEVDANSGIIGKLLARFKDTGYLNDADLFVDLQVPGFIMDKAAYGGTSLAAETIKGKTEIKNFAMNNFYDAKITADGMLSGFGKKPVFEKMNYTFETDDFRNFLRKIGREDAFSKVRKTGKISSRGVLDGEVEKLNFKTVTTVDDVDIVYDGLIEDKAGQGKFISGDLNIKANDFAEFMQDFLSNDKYNFIAKTMFSFASYIEGNYNKFTLSGLDALIGSVNIKGTADVDTSNEVAYISGDLDINNLDFAQFLLQKKVASDKVSSVTRSVRRAEFLEKPYFDTTPLNYDMLNNVNFSGSVNVGRASYNYIVAEDLSAKVKIADGKMNVYDLSADYNEGKVEGYVDIDPKDAEKGFAGKLKFTKIPVNNLDIAGSTYGIINGTTDLEFEFKTAPASVSDMILKMFGNVSFDMYDVTLKGWSMQPIYNDLKERKESKGFYRFVSENINRNTTSFKGIKGNILIEDAKFMTQNGSDISLIADDYQISSTLSGNLEEWTIDDINTIAFQKMKEIPGMSITCGGDMEKPKCKADVQAITDKYDHYWQQIEEEKARRQAEIDKQNRDALHAENEKLKPIKKELEEDLIPQIEDYMNVVRGDDVKQQMQAAYDKAKYVKEGIDYLLALENKERIEPEDIELAKGKDKGYRASIAELKETTDQIYEISIRNDYASLYDSIINVYKNAKLKIAEYKTIVNKLIMEGSQMYPPIDFKKDQDYAKTRKSVDDNYREIDKIYLNVMQNYYEGDKRLPIDMLEEYNSKIYELDDKIKKKSEKMIEDIASSLSYMRGRVADKQEESKKFEEEQKIIEAEKKLEEQKQEEARKEAEAASDGQFRLKPIVGEVKNATGSITRTDGSDRKNPAPAEEKKPSFLRAIVGEIKEFTGEIIKKE